MSGSRMHWDATKRPCRFRVLRIGRTSERSEEQRGPRAYYSVLVEQLLARWTIQVECLVSSLSFFPYYSRVLLSSRPCSALPRLHMLPSASQGPTSHHAVLHRRGYLEMPATMRLDNTIRGRRLQIQAYVAVSAWLRWAAQVSK